MHRSNPWASDRLKRYGKESIKGLKDRTKGGRSPSVRRGQSPDQERTKRKQQSRVDNKTG